MKSLCAAIALGAAACASTLCAGEGRVDINGMKESVSLSPGEASSNGKCYNANWMEGDKNKQYVVGIFPGGTEWTQGSCTFTPDKDGTLTVYLRGPWNKEKTPVWTVFDSVTADGASLANGGFEEEGGWQLRGKDENKAEIVAGGKEGKGVKVAHDYPAIQDIQVKAGKPVKITFWYKSVE